MKKTQLITHLATLLVAAVLLASPSSALDVYLVAGAYDKTIGAESIPMWGFAEATDNSFGTIGDFSSPGPRIAVPAGDTTLNITLKNNLAVPVSIVIPGQPAALAPVRSGNRVTAFTAQTAPGATAAYTWTNLKPGTFIYHSGSHLARQVHMGLYGAVTVEANPNEAYPGVSYANEVVLFYSEIDPDLHASAGAAHPNGYNPRYFLVNGAPYESGAPAMAAGSVNQPTLVRMLSASLGDLVPTLLGGSWNLVAEDGNPYPFPRTQHTTLLSALKTKDALITPTREGTFTVFDRRGRLTNDGAMPGGMMAKLAVGTATGAPVANPDSATVAEGGTVAALDSTADSVLANDSPSTGVTAILVDNVLNGTLTLDADGTFSYTHNGSETSGDAFTYRINDGAQDSNITTVTIAITPVNEAPSAAGDAYEVASGQTLNVAAPGVLSNDTDPEGDALTAVLDSGAGSGSLALNPDGSFAYTPNTGTTSDSFTYVARDGSLLVSAPATVTITVTAPPANQAPTANADFGSTKVNTPVTITVIANDTDPDGNIDPAGVVVTSGGTSARGGTVANQNNGTVIYTPKRNFRGTDTFTYTVRDSGTPPLTSNEATVQVNVTR